jgi:O-antigen/teichoic acid export membrane protein
MAATAEAVGVRRLTRGILANMLGQGVNACSQIVLVPVFLTHWGKQLYGEWLTLSAFVAYLAIIDFGMQNFVVNRLNQCYANGDVREHRRVLHSALSLSLAFSILAVLLAAPVLMFAPLGRWFHFSVTSSRAASAVAIVLMLQVVGAVPNGLIGGIYRSVGEYPRGQMITNGRNLAVLCLAVAAILAGGGLLAVACAQLAALILASAFMWRDLSSRHPEISLGIRHADVRLALAFLGPSSLFFLIQLSMALTLQGSAILIGAVLGALSVAVFVPLRTLSNLVRQVIGALFSALWPEFTALEASGRYADLRRAHLFAAKVLVTISAAAAVFLHFSGRDIVAFWTHSRIRYDPVLMDAFLGLLVSQAVWLASSLVLAASNNHRRMALVSLVAASAGLGLGYAGLHAFGMPGLVYGIWIAEFSLTGTVVVSKACRLIGQSLGMFATDILLRGSLVLLSLYFVLRTLAVAAASSNPLARVALLGVASAGVALVSAYVLYLGRAERSKIKSLLWQCWGRAAVEPAP